MADKERTPLLRGDGGRRKRQGHNENKKHIRSRSAGPPHRRSFGEVFTLDDDNRTLHKTSQHGSEHGELQRNYSRFLLYGGDVGHSSGVSSTSTGSGAGTKTKRSHRRQWSSATEPHRNLTNPRGGNQNQNQNQKPFPTQHETLRDGRDKKRDNNSKTVIQFERDDFATVVREDCVIVCNIIVSPFIRLLPSYFQPHHSSLKTLHFQKHMMVLLSYLVLLAYTLLVLFGPLFLLSIDKTKWCPESESLDPSSTDDDDTIYDEPHYENPDYITDACFHRRLPELLGLTLEECDLSRRMLASVLFGGAIGYERRVADRPAGIRTMGLVSLGSCFFTISSQLAFKSSTMGWDASRVTAAIPTGVGFLGAGLIWKGTVGVGEEEVHQVHGLTTAASLWLSAAVGAGAGGAMYFVSAYSVILVILILRYGPQMYMQDDASYNDEEEEEEKEWEGINDKKTSKRSVGLYMSGRSVGRTDDVSLEGDESCPSFVSFTDLQHAKLAENDSLRITTPPPYGSTADATEGDTERHSILRTPGTAGSSPGQKSGGRNVQITFGDDSPPPLSSSGRETSEARSIASRSSSVQKRLSSKVGKAQKKRSMSKRPTFHS